MREGAAWLSCHAIRLDLAWDILDDSNLKSCRSASVLSFLGLPRMRTIIPKPGFLDLWILDAKRRSELRRVVSLEIRRLIGEPRIADRV